MRTRKKHGHNQLERMVDSEHSRMLLDRPPSIASDDTTGGSPDHADRFTPILEDSEMTFDCNLTQQSDPHVSTVSHSEVQPFAPTALTPPEQVQHHPKHAQHWLLDASSPPVPSARLDSLAPHKISTSIFGMPERTLDPKTFVKMSIWYCNLRSEGMYDDADAAASEAGRVYAHILSQQHSHALISLNTVLIMLLLYERDTEAFELMSRAREAARSIFHETHPIILTIGYLIFQAADKFEAVQVSQLAEGYNFFCNDLGQDHPHTLVAGYLLAWRSAVNNTNDIGMLHAIQLLCKLQLISDTRLGRYHLLSIAILSTKARVQHTLKMLPDAITNMEDVLRRMQDTHDDNHPHLLDARSRYAAMLFAAHREDEAETEYIASALGKAKLFGTEAQTTKNSLREIGTFFVTTSRAASASDFSIKLAAVSASYSSPGSGIVMPKVAI